MRVVLHVSRAVVLEERLYEQILRRFRGHAGQQIDAASDCLLVTCRWLLGLVPWPKDRASQSGSAIRDDRPDELVGLACSAPSRTIARERCSLGCKNRCLTLRVSDDGGRIADSLFSTVES